MNTPIQACLDRAGLTQVGAARLLGVGDRTMRRWCAGPVEAPLAVLMLFEAAQTESDWSHAMHDDPNSVRKILEHWRNQAEARR